MPTVPYTKQTWTDGVSALSAARMGVIENGINDVSFAPAVRVTHNTTQSIANNTDTAVAFNTERFDTAGNAADTMHDTVTNNSRLTCRYAGKYMIGANIEWAASPNIPLIRLRLNGTTVIAAHQVALSTGDYRIQQIQTLYDLAVNDFVQVFVIQNSGGALNLLSSGNYAPEFWMVRVA